MSFQTSVQPQLTKSFVDAIIGCFAAVPAFALLRTPKLHLLLASVALTENTTVADLTPSEATYTGYTPGGIALPAPSGPFDLLPTIDGNIYHAVFAVSGPVVTTNTIFGYWVDGNTGADLYFAEIFATPSAMVAVGDFLDLDVLLGVSKLLNLSA